MFLLLQDRMETRLLRRPKKTMSIMFITFNWAPLNYCFPVFDLLHWLTIPLPLSVSLSDLNDLVPPTPTKVSVYLCIAYRADASTLEHSTYSPPPPPTSRFTSVSLWATTVMPPLLTASFITDESKIIY